MNPQEEVTKLCELMEFLRSPGGCGWDRAQTLSSLRPYLLEETYEVLEEMDHVEESPTQENASAHCAELGDLLLQIIFQAQIQKENHAFDFNAVCKGLREKLIRRHPHLFTGDNQPQNTNENPHWEKVKEKERAAKNSGNNSVLEGVPKAMPALLRAQTVAKKADAAGFGWPDVNGALLDFEEEIAELQEAMLEKDATHIEHELGDVLFSVVNIARYLKLDAEACLQKATKRFQSRFQHVEKRFQHESKVMAEASLEDLNAYWEDAKKHLEQNTREPPS